MPSSPTPVKSPLPRDGWRVYFAGRSAPGRHTAEGRVSTLYGVCDLRTTIDAMHSLTTRTRAAPASERPRGSVRQRAPPAGDSPPQRRRRAAQHGRARATSGVAVDGGGTAGSAVVVVGQNADPPPFGRRGPPSEGYRQRTPVPRRRPAPRGRHGGRRAPHRTHPTARRSRPFFLSLTRTRALGPPVRSAPGPRAGGGPSPPPPPPAAAAARRAREVSEQIQPPPPPPPAGVPRSACRRGGCALGRRGAGARAARALCHRARAENPPRKPPRAAVQRPCPHFI